MSTAGEHPVRPKAQGCVSLLVSVAVFGLVVGSSLGALNLWGRSQLGPRPNAARDGDLAAVTSLLNGGADLNHPSKFNRWTALHAAADEGHVKVVRLLLARGANVHVQDGDGYTPLHNTADAFTKGSPSDATGPQRLAIAALLLAAGANVNAQTNYGHTTLHRATSENNAALAELLLEHAADPNVTNKGRTTPLHLAAFEGPDRSAIARMLLRHGADPDVRDEHGKTALHYADKYNRNVAAAIREQPGK